MNTKKPKLTLIRGGAGLSTSAKENRHDRLLVLNMHHLKEFSRFTELLDKGCVRTVIDARISPSSPSPVFSHEAVMGALISRDCPYERYETLANHFIGEQEGVQKYIHFLVSECSIELGHLRERIRNGPALLLGDYSVYHSSSTAALVDVVLRHEAPFAVEVLCSEIEPT